MSRAGSVCRIQTRKLVTGARFWAVMILTAIYMWDTWYPIGGYLKDTAGRIDFFGLMTYIFNDATAGAFLSCGCLALLFDMPCIDDLQRAVLLRAGRSSWGKGQLRYCAFVCAMYLLAVLGMVFVMALPYMEFTLEWSSGVKAFVEDFAYETYDSMLNYDTWIMRCYVPLPAFLLELVLRFMMLYMLGVLMGCINVTTGSRLGFIAAAVPMAADLLLEQFFSDSIRYFSPFTLCRLSGLDYGDGMGRPPVWYAAVILPVLGILLSLLFHAYVRRRELRM